MKWPWQHDHDEHRHLVRAELRLAHVVGKWPLVIKASGDMNAWTEENGFAQKIRVAMGVSDK